MIENIRFLSCFQFTLLIWCGKDKYLEITEKNIFSELTLQKQKVCLKEGGVCVWGVYLLEKIMKGGLEGPGGGWRVQYENIIQTSKNLMDKCKFIRLYTVYSAPAFNP